MESTAAGIEPDETGSADAGLDSGAETAGADTDGPVDLGEADVRTFGTFTATAAAGRELLAEAGFDACAPVAALPPRPAGCDEEELGAAPSLPESAHAVPHPENTAAPTPSATARPPTRPT
jgi:hypothetical protein